MTKAPIPTEKSKKQHDKTQTLPKTSITQLLWTDLGRSVGITIATQLVWLNRFTGAQNSHLPQKLCNQQDTLIRTFFTHYLFKFRASLFRKGPKYREPVSFSWHQNFDIIMDACEAYARRWAKKEDVEIDTLSEWIKSIGDVLKRRIRQLKHFVNTRHESIFSYPDVVKELSRLHENFVIVPADKTSNNYTFVCKRYYVDILIEELGLHLLPGNPIYNLTDFSASEVLDINRFSLPSEYRQPMRSWICHTFIGFQRCTKIPINTDSLRVPRSVRPSL